MDEIGKDQEDTLIAIEGLKIAISEVSEYLSGQKRSMVVLGDTAKIFFTAASVITSLVISYNLFFVKVDPSWSLVYWILTGLLILVYCGFTYFSIRGIFPVPMHKAFPDDYDSLTKSLCVPEIDRLAQILSNYLCAFYLNKKVVSKKASCVMWSAILWGIMIVVIILMAAIPRVLFTGQ